MLPELVFGRERRKLLQLLGLTVVTYRFFFLILLRYILPILYIYYILCHHTHTLHHIYEIRKKKEKKKIIIIIRYNAEEEEEAARACRGCCYGGLGELLELAEGCSWSCSGRSSGVHGAMDEGAVGELGWCVVVLGELRLGRT